MCGNCIYHKITDGEWVCDNSESENYGLETEYNDSCVDCEEINAEDD